MAFFLGSWMIIGFKFFRYSQAEKLKWTQFKSLSCRELLPWRQDLLLSYNKGWICYIYCKRDPKIPKRSEIFHDYIHDVTSQRIRNSLILVLWHRSFLSSQAMPQTGRPSASGWRRASPKRMVMFCTVMEICLRFHEFFEENINWIKFENSKGWIMNHFMQ